MPKTIQQRVVFKKASAGFLYELYMDAKLHKQSTGAPVAIKKKVGADFTAYDNYCYGKNLQLIPGKLIVQSWKASDWKEDALESTLILLFEQQGNDAVVTMVHANVPDDQHKELTGGWKDFYWNPWKAYLKKSEKE